MISSKRRLSNGRWRERRNHIMRISNNRERRNRERVLRIRRRLVKVIRYISLAERGQWDRKIMRIYEKCIEKRNGVCCVLINWFIRFLVFDLFLTFWFAILGMIKVGRGRGKVVLSLKYYLKMFLSWFVSIKHKSTLLIEKGWWLREKKNNFFSWIIQLS